MTPAQIESNLAAIPDWTGELTRHLRAHIKKEFAELTEFYKWNCIMWHKDGELVLGAVPLKQAFKLCFFRPSITDSKLPVQRWSQTVVSRNMVVTSRETFELDAAFAAIRSSIAE